MPEQQELKNLYIIRDGVLDDRPFIFSTALRGLYYGNVVMRETPKNIFMKRYHEIFERIMDLPTVEIKVACLADDPSVILGYSIIGGNGTIAHWCFVKSAWRKIGIAKALVPNTIKSFTHRTSLSDSIMKKHVEVKYDPFTIE